MQQNHGLCQLCHDSLPYRLKTCQQCGLAIYSNASHCGQCIQNPPNFGCLIALCDYQSPIDYLLNQFKFQHKLAYGNVLGQLLVNKLRLYYHKNPLPDIILPVPLHAKRLRERGYNQAVELARPIAKRLNRPLDTTSVSRIVNTPPQAELAAKNRARNIKQVFQINHPLANQRIAIIDDIVTTGNTVNELSRVLKQAGAAHISVWCCARTQINV